MCEMRLEFPAPVKRLCDTSTLHRAGSACNLTANTLRTNEFSRTSVPNIQLHSGWCRKRDQTTGGPGGELFPAAARERGEPRCGLWVDRARLHDGLRDHRDDQ